MRMDVRIKQIVLWLFVFYGTTPSLASNTLPDHGHLNPLVNTFHGVLTADECKAIIAQAELRGFPMEADSIDNGEVNNTYSQQIDIVEHGEVEDETLWKLVEPFMEKLTEIVQQTKENVWDLERAREKKSRAEWIFLRKYAPTTERNMLRLHQDSNMFTVNLFLSDEYEGGGLFYVRPPVGLGTLGDTPIPNVPDEWLTYDWLADIKRKNTTTAVFPELKQGDVLIHNYTVWHAIAPLDAGFKYSLLFFFDMDNPDIQSFISKRVDVTFVNFATNGTIDLAWLDGRSSSFELNIKVKAMPVGQDVNILTNEREIWRAIRREDGEVVAEFYIEPGNTEPYMIYEQDDVMSIFINRVISGTIDLWWIHTNEDESGSDVLIEEAMEVGVEIHFKSFQGHTFRAIRREDNLLIKEFLIDITRTEPYEVIENSVGSDLPTGENDWNYDL